MKMEGILPWDFHIVKAHLDEESILFCTFFFFTIFIHIQLEGSFPSYWRREINWNRKKCSFTRSIFKSFLTQVSRQLSWQQFFEALYLSNKTGNRERIQFIQKFLPEFPKIPFEKQSNENEKQTVSVFDSEVQSQSFSQENESKVFYAKNHAAKGQEQMSELSDFYKRFTALKSPNPQAPSMENFVEIKRTKERGRCLIATKNTPMGSTLLVEKPFVATLDVYNKQVISKRCYHCFQKILGSKVSCQKCHFANFCSNSCLLAASSSYHKYECPCFPLLSDIYRHNPSISHIVALVTRTICSLGPQKLYKMYMDSKHENEIPTETTASAIYESSDYKRILELHQKIDEFSDWTAPLTCLILVKILRSQSLFFTEIETHFHADEFQEFVATLMLHNFESFLLNCFSLQQPETTTERGAKSSKREDSKYESYGTAVFTTTSLINHSCLPNATVAFESRFGTTVVTSLRDLRAGEEIQISYGPTVNSENSETAKDRIRYLKEGYGFDCDCQGCSRGWPGLKFALEFNSSVTQIPSDLTCPQHPLEKLAEGQDILDQLRQKNCEDILSPSLLQTQDDYKHLLWCCVSTGRGQRKE